MAAATQRAPGQPGGAQGAKGAQGAPARGGSDQEREKAGIRQRLHELPRAAGIAILAVMLVLSLFVGNFRALSAATPKAFLRQGDVQSILEDRIDAAQNALTVARRAGIGEAVAGEVEDAAQALQQAKSARDISRADQKLTTAVSGMVADASAGLDEENRRMLQAAADDFAEQGSFLRQEARSFNEQAVKAEALYEKLPTRFLLAEPDVYEGI